MSPPTHTSGFACARLQCGLTCGRASGAWIIGEYNDKFHHGDAEKAQKVTGLR
jgi:hypothetical protein